MCITDSPEGEEAMAETIFEVITATYCPRKGFDRIRAARFPPKKRLKPK